MSTSKSRTFRATDRAGNPTAFALPRASRYNDFVLRLSLVLCVACSSGAGTSPLETTGSAKTTAVTPDAAAPEPPPTPKLVCDADTAPIPAPAPEPTWYCARPDGTRHGPFLTLYPDGSIEIRGTYKDGELDGTWEQLYPGGAPREVGEYAAGNKTGKWIRKSAAGAVLGEYEMKDGTGIEKQWLDDGQLYSETPYKSGVIDGTAKIYGKNNFLLGSTRYKAGKLDGPHSFGTRNSMRMEETFVAGVRRGKRKIFHQGGLIAEEHFDRKGRLDGPYTLWRDAKVFRVKGQFSGGRRTGAWEWRDKKDRKEKEGSYYGGRRDGAWSEWVDEKLVWSGTYDKGKPNGTFTYWDKNGNEIGKYDIKDGTGWVYTYWSNKKPYTKQRVYKGYEDGLYQEFTRAGKLVVEGHFAGVMKHGGWKEWTFDGVLRAEETWKRGKLEGKVKKYVDGKPSMEATYVDGKAEGPYVEYRLGTPSLTGQFAADAKTGTWTSYAADGSVVRIATYKDGGLDGPYRELTGGVVIEGSMVAGRRSGTWTRTDKAGAVRKLTYRSP